MQHRQLIYPGDHCSHREDAGTLLVPTSPWVAQGIDTLSSAYFLILSFLDYHIYTDDWLLKTFDTFGKKFFYLCISTQQLWFSGVFNTFKQNMNIQLIFESLSEHISYKWNHGWVLTLYLQLHVSYFLVIFLCFLGLDELFRIRFYRNWI
jgi:hypothetical protein